MKFQTYKNNIWFESTNEMEWHKMNCVIFLKMRMRKRHLHCTSSHHNVPYVKQQELNEGSEPWNEYSW